jgi:tRNA/tmRNA/rRNA uracil-C5-methylase (TrmA/RlmC/RlmD family)
MLADCPITDERVVASWREIMGATGLFPSARELRASIRLVEGGTAVVMQGGTEWPTRDEFFEAVPSMAALWWTPLHGQRQLVRERVPTPGGASFTQINADVAARLSAHVVERVLAYTPAHVIDGYAGTGDTAVTIAAAGVRVTAIEMDVDAAARSAARLPRPSRSMSGRVEDVLPRALPADVVVLNPPRTGLDARVSRELQRTGRAPRAIVYVSCDPATLARDIARMPRYRIASVRGFDMFPQTAHVETACELVPVPA